MATRKQLQDQVRDATVEMNRMARENEMLSKEVAYHQEREKANLDAAATILRDRDRLTATIEVLARRIASDRSQQLTPVNERPFSGTGKSSYYR
jgi:hypothetical protein